MKTKQGKQQYIIKEINGYQKLFAFFETTGKFDFDWAFRAQPYGSPLETTLERHCKKSGYTLLEDAVDFEESLITQFSRIYDGDDWQTVQSDELYCLSLMRHFGAPSRLLDFTYSKYVAIYFAFENAYDHMQSDKQLASEIWCIDLNELQKKNKNKYPSIKGLLEKRSEHKTRNNKTFKELYHTDKYKAVVWENPVKLHTRLHLQQGVFLCPCSVRIPFMDNLLHPYRNNIGNKLIKIICRFPSPDDLQNGLERCRLMNLTRESLFPGLDGFTQSLNYQFQFLKKLDYRRKSERAK